MRGPLESLIAQKSARTEYEKRFPHRFLPKPKRTIINASLMPWGSDPARFSNIFANPHETNYLTPKSEESRWAAFLDCRQEPLSFRIAPYLFGYRNKIESGMIFGQKCDKKGAKEGACVRDFWFFPDL
jgi:hypothetical protein